MASLQIEKEPNRYRRELNQELVTRFSTLDFGDLCAAARDAFVFSTAALPSLGEFFASAGMNVVQDAVQTALKQAMQEKPRPAGVSAAPLTDAAMPRIAPAEPASAA